MNAQAMKARPLGHPIGYHAIHPDVSLNFQMNRWFSWVGDVGMLDDMRTVAPRITTYADWQREFAALAQQALANVRNPAQILKAAYDLRAAEFFVQADDPQRKPMREQFVQLTRDHYGVKPNDQHRVPYSDELVQGFLPVYRFTPTHPKGTMVFFGGINSYLEDLFLGFFWLRYAGYGRAIAYDIFFDAFDCSLRQVPTSIRLVLLALLRLKLDVLVNALTRRAVRRGLVIGWGLRHAMHMTGTTTPAACLHAIQHDTTAEISSRVTQDVLLLAGSEDHLVPLAQFYRQIGALTNTRLLTARLFTRAESAQNHCQAGNYGLASQVIAAWLDAQAARDQQG